MSRTAIVVNPTKCADVSDFRALAADVLGDAGRPEPLFFETSPEDAGTAVARQAVAEGADLVIACGGDGTIAACVAALAGTPVPLGVVALGTGNLFARNLGLPLDPAAALRVAITGRDRPLDVARLNGEPFVVMAGIGLDAVMLTDATDELKARLGWTAYIMAALRHLGDRPVAAQVRLDDEPPLFRKVNGIIVGNVGHLQAGIPLLPDADPSDGYLDLALLAPGGVLGWLRVLWAAAASRRGFPELERLRARRIQIKTAKPMACERDGEVTAACDQLDIDLTPGALLVRMPANG